MPALNEGTAESVAAVVTDERGLISETRSSRKSAAVLGGLLLVALAARIPPMGTSLWIDEATTYSMASRSWAELVRLFGEEPNGLLYALVVHPLLGLGRSEWILRLPALIAGVGAVAGLWWAARELEWRRAAVPAAALLAVSPLAVSVSTDARPYSSVVLMSCLSMGAVARAVRCGGRRWWATYAACLVALVYLNALALLVVPVHALVILRGARRPWRAWLVSSAFAAVATLPLAVLLAQDRADRDPLYWLTSRSVADFARETAKYLGYHPVLAAVELIVIGAAAVAARGQLRALRRSSYLRHRLIPVLGWAWLPPFAVLAISQVSPLIKARYFVVALPGMCLLVAVCLLAWSRAVSIGLLVLLMIGSAAVVVERNWRFDRMGEDWRGAVQRLEAMRAPEESVIFEYAEGLTVAGYYAPSFRLPDGRTVVTEWDHRVPPGVLVHQPVGGYSEVPVGPVSVAALEERVRSSGRAFVVEPDYELVGPEVFDGSGAEWARARCTVDSHVFTRVVVTVVSMCRADKR